jgi:sarcosine oxidase subunit gamma
MTVQRCTPGARYGVKGADAERWLLLQGIAIPTSANRIKRWPQDGGGRCLRLGQTEFLVEHDAPGSRSPAAAAPMQAGAAAWVLLREDCSLLLDAALCRDVLPQACSFDFSRLDGEPDLVVMTLLAGISVTLAREPATDASLPALRLWCDASYATYLQQCLHQLAMSVPGESR